MRSGISRTRLGLLFLLAVAAWSVTAQGDEQPRPTDRPDEIPQIIGKNGRFVPGGMRFTAKAYEQEALNLVIREANQVAKDLHLREQLPITTNLQRVFILGYGMSQMPPKMIGNVHTRDYGYFVSVGHRLSYVEGAHQDEDCLKWMEQYQWPMSRLDTNAAYQIATQWLAAARMDVAALNRDCQVRVEPERYVNQGLEQTGKFVPIYFVYWESAQNRAEGYGNVASVKLLAPTKTLMSLRVEDPKYIRRPPIVFTNLASLLAQTNAPVSQ